MGVILLGTVMALSLSSCCHKHPRHGGHTLRSDDEHTGTRCCAAGTCHTAHLEQRCGVGCAVTYPLGVVGVIFAMILLRKLFVRKEDLQQCNSSADDSTYVGQFICVNPAISGKTIAQISQSTHRHFIISRIWRDGKVIVPLAQTVMQHGDNVLVVTNRDEVAAMNILFGEHVEKDWNREKIDWNAIDSSVESRVIVMTRSRLNGKTLGSLHMRETYGVNVSRVMRGDIKLLATDSLHLQYGDRVTIVGTPEDINHAEAFLGNAVTGLNEPNLGAIFFGLLLGLALGMIPISIPGMSAPVSLASPADQSSWVSSSARSAHAYTSSPTPRARHR